LLEVWVAQQYPKEHLAIIESIKDGSCFFIYHPSKLYAKKSKIINAKISLASIYNEILTNETAQLK
jgi:hypothetical protein